MFFPTSPNMDQSIGYRFLNPPTSNHLYDPPQLGRSSPLFNGMSCQGEILFPLLSWMIPHENPKRRQVRLITRRPGSACGTPGCLALPPGQNLVERLESLEVEPSGIGRIRHRTNGLHSCSTCVGSGYVCFA